MLYMINSNIERKPRLSSLTYLCFMMNAALDNNRGSDIGFSDVHQAIQTGGIIAFLEMRLGDDVDLGILSMEAGEHEAIVKALDLAAQALQGRERRKLEWRTTDVAWYSQSR